MNKLAVCVLIALTVGNLRPLAPAQSTSATVFGTVSDEQGAVIPGVSITLQRIETGESRTLTTDARGSFRVIGLVPGRYQLRAALQPFADVILSEIVLGLHEETGIPVTMRLGAVTDRLTVAADVPIGGVPLTTLGRGFTPAEI